MKRIIQKLLAAFNSGPGGRATHDVMNVIAPPTSRTSFEDIILQAKKNGLYPKTVIDVGAASGSMTEIIASCFPDSRFIMIEPLSEFRLQLETVKNKLTDAQIFCVAASDKDGAATFNVHDDLVGSSLYREIEGVIEGSSVDGRERSIPSTTLNSICQKVKAQGPYLIKVDVQGAELNVIKGASNILSETEFIILEVSLFGFFIDGPQLTDVIIFMKEQGFVCYDIFGLQYRLLDNALSQLDMVFVKENGMFRMNHSYATKEQRQFQNAQMKALYR